MTRNKAIIYIALLLYAVAWPLLAYYFIWGSVRVCDVAQFHTVKWISRAAEAGNIEGQFRIGQYYSNGYSSRTAGVLIQPNIIHAYKWYVLAAKSGNQLAQAELNNLDKSMNAEQITVAKRLADEWKPDLTLK